ncbi:MAG: tetratricopeptide repeat protein [Flavobacteriales bacterium]|nr:tetratricopeptide repeat protein [Flavobacteriales bacterium]
MFRNWWSVSVLTLIGYSCPAQNARIVDSLGQELKLATNDSFKVSLLNELSWYSCASDVEQAKEYAKSAIALARKLNDMELMANSFNSMGMAFDYEGVGDSVTWYYHLALGLKKRLKDRKGTSNILNNIGVSHYYHGDYDSSMAYLMAALSIRELLGDTEQIGQSFNNIGLIYRT